MGFFLLIIAVLVAWFFISAISRANRRMAYADQKDAERELKASHDDPHLMPTWAMKPGRTREFMARVEIISSSRQVPAQFVEMIYRDGLEYHRIMHFVALLERRNASTSAQATAAADYIFDKWVAHEYHKVGLPTWGRDKSELSAFINEVKTDLKERKVAPPFFVAFLDDSAAIEAMMRAVTDAEHSGSSRADQVAAAAQVVTDRWISLPKEEQDRLWSQDFSNIMREASEATQRLRALAAKPSST